MIYDVKEIFINTIVLVELLVSIKLTVIYLFFRSISRRKIISLMKIPNRYSVVKSPQRRVVREGGERI